MRVASFFAERVKPKGIVKARASGVGMKALAGEHRLARFALPWTLSVSVAPAMVTVYG